MERETKERRMEFSVQVDEVVEFTAIVEEYELQNAIVGKDQDDEEAILIEVEYNDDEKEAIYKLLEITQGEDIDSEEEEEED